MRNYWLRIGLRALAIFGVGMVVVAMVRAGEHRVAAVANSAEPITIPLAFIPFKVSGTKLGTLSKVVLVRKSPHQVDRVRLHVKLDDSVPTDRLANCLLAADFTWTHRDAKLRVERRRYEQGTFHCAKSDSVGNLAEYGTATFQPSGLTIPLLLPEALAADLRKGDFDFDAADSVAEAAEARSDSISDAIEARADSLEQVGESLASQVEEQSRLRADSIREAVSRKMDSVRARH